MALVLNGDVGVVLPTWTTSNRPASPAAGQFGFNSTTSKFEVYNGTTWINMG